MSHLNVEQAVTDDGACLVYRLSGVLGESSYCFEFGEAVRTQIKDGPNRIVLDLGDLEYITSSGVGIIAGAYTSASNQQKTLVLSSVPKKVRRVLEICGLLDVVDVFDDEAAAIQG